MKVYTSTSAENSIQSDQINCIYTDRNGTIWIGTTRGISKYFPQSDDFKTYLFNDSFEFEQKANVSAITQDEKGTLHVADKAGSIYQYHESSDTFKRMPQTQIPDLNSLLFDMNNDCLWAGAKNVLVCIKPSGIVNFPLPKNDGNDSYVKSITQIDNFLILSIYPGKVKIFDTTKRTFISEYDEILPSIFALDCAKDAQDRLWLTTPLGLYRIDLNSKDVKIFTHDESNEKSLSYTGCTTLYFDNHNNMWVGTVKGGVNLGSSENSFSILQQSEKTPNSLSRKEVTSLYVDNNDMLWVGYPNYIDRFENDHITKAGTYRPTNYIQKIDAIGSIWCFAERKGQLYAGHNDLGLIRLNQKKNQFEKISLPDQLSNFDSDLRSISIDNQDNLWMAFHGKGIVMLNPDTKTFKTFTEKNSNLPNNWVEFIHLDHKNKLFVVLENSLMVLEEDGHELEYCFYGVENPNLPFTINVIHEDAHNHKYIGTSSGLVRLTDENEIYFIKTTEIFNIKSIRHDQNNILWLGTSNGLFSFNTRKNEVTSIYNIEDGVSFNEFSKRASTKTRDGTLFFGTPNGITSFHPETLMNNDIPPKVYIREIRLFDENISPKIKEGHTATHRGTYDSIALQHDQNLLSFEFGAIDFKRHNNIRLHYKLQGVDNDWNVGENGISKSYSNLPPGQYTFRVKAVHSNHTNGSTEKQLSLTIAPPYWKMPWFKMLLFIVLLGLVTLAYLWRIRQIKIQKKKLEIVIKGRTNSLLAKQKEVIDQKEKLQLFAESLKHANEARTKFFMNISHELRTPLSLILGPLEGMLDNPKSIETHQLKMVSRNAKKLLKLVNQLLDARKLETGMMRLGVMQGDIVDFAKNIFESFQYMASKTNIAYNFTHNINDTNCYFDHEILEKVLFNLISNAFKYTPSNGTITLAIRDVSDNNDEPYHQNPIENRCIELKVMDSGSGIAKEVHDKIFKRFFRPNDHLTKNNIGSGIGLSITKDFIELHKGHLKLESEKDKGSTFTVILPVSKDFFGDEEFVKNNISLSEHERYPHLHREYQPELLDSSVDLTFDIHDPTLLIVEDNIELQSFLTELLVPHYNVRVASNGVQGVSMANEFVPDLIISDVMMPEMDGLEFAGHIRSNEITNHIPLILLTAKASNAYKIKGIQTGADDYLVKPFDPTILKLKIKVLLENRERLKKKFSSDSFKNFAEREVLSADTSFLSKFKAHIEKNFKNPDFDLDELCKSMHLSRSQLYKKIKAITNHSPNDFIRNTRLEYAVLLLKEKSVLTVSEIAYESGFKNPRQFTRYFKEKYNVLPSSFIEKCTSS